MCSLLKSPGVFSYIHEVSGLSGHDTIKNIGRNHVLVQFLDFDSPIGMPEICDNYYS